MTSDGTTQVITSKHLSEVSASDGQFNITIHIGVVSTTIDDRDLNSILTTQDHLQVTIHVGILTGSNQLLYLHRTSSMISIGSTCIDHHISENSTLRVTCTVCFVDITTPNQSIGIARIYSSTDISTRIRNPVSTIKGVLILTITTTKHMLNLMGTQYQDVRFRNHSGITTTINFLNTDITSGETDHRFLICSRFIVCQVTATIDSSHLIDMGRCCANYLVLCVTSKFGSHQIITSGILTGYRPIDSHRHVALWRTVQVITTEHTTTIHYLCTLIICNISSSECSRSRCRRILCLIT